MMCYKITYIHCKTKAKNNLKRIYLNRQVNDQELTMLFFDHFSVKINFFFSNLNFSESVFFYLISSSQNFVTLLSKTDKAIKKSCCFLKIFKGSQLCLIFLNKSRINFEIIWELLFLHKHRFADKGKSSLM